MVASISFSSASTNQGLENSFEAYHDLYAPVADAIRIGGSFAAEVEAYRLSDVILFDRRLSGLRHQRSPRRVARDGFDHFTVQIVLKGELHVSTEARDVRLSEGELAFIDMNQSMATTSENSRTLTLSVPRWSMENAFAGAHRLHGVSVAPGRTSLLSDFLCSFLRNAQSHGAVDRAEIGRVALDLLKLAVSELPSDDATPTSAASDAVCRQRARRFIEANPRATPEEVADAIGRSRSALYRAFKSSGGVARYIRSRRIARMRSALTQPGQSRRVSEIAYECGFSSDSDAVRAFRSAYGVTPGDFRTAVLDGAQSKADAPGQLFAQWWNELR